MKMQILGFAFLLALWNPAIAYWSIKGKDVYFFCTGDHHAVSGLAFTCDEVSGKSMKDANNLDVRISCVSLDGSPTVFSNATISTSGPGSSNGRCSERGEISLSEGCEIEDTGKNCADNEYVGGLKISGGGTRFKLVCCQLPNGYETDSASGCRTIGPLQATCSQPSQFMFPADGNVACGVDAFSALGIGMDGVKIKTCSIRKTGKYVNPGCKLQKDLYAVQENKKLQQFSGIGTAFNTANLGQPFGQAEQPAGSQPSNQQPGSQPSNQQPMSGSSNQQPGSQQNQQPGLQPNQQGGQSNQQGSQPNQQSGPQSSNQHENHGIGSHDKNHGHNGSGKKHGTSKGKKANNIKSTSQKVGQNGKNTGHNASQQGQRTGQNSANQGKRVGDQSKTGGLHAAENGRNIGNVGKATGKGAADTSVNAVHGAGQTSVNAVHGAGNAIKG